jgi:hypothetical protein
VVEVRSAGNIGTLVLVVILKFPARVGLAVQLVLIRIRILPASVSGRVYPLCCPPIVAARRRSLTGSRPGAREARVSIRF